MASQIDLDYFAIWISPEDLSFQGPLVNLTDVFPSFKIQDPVVKQWKSVSCISFAPYIICLEDDEEFSKRKQIVEYLNTHGSIVLQEANIPGPFIMKQHFVPTKLLQEALVCCEINFIRLSNYGAKGKLKHLLRENTFWNILQKGHMVPSTCKVPNIPNVTFDFALSVRMENILLFKKPNSVPLENMWPMLNWLGDGFGGFVFYYDDNPDLKIKIYSLLHHQVCTCK